MSGRYRDSGLQSTTLEASNIYTSGRYRDSGLQSATLEASNIYTSGRYRDSGLQSTTLEGVTFTRQVDIGTRVYNLPHSRRVG
jgi:hypothetical protein